MKSSYRIIWLFIFFLVIRVEIYSQNQNGYLLRCYVSSDTIEWNTLMNYEKFSNFLPEYDLIVDSTNQVSYEQVREGDLFSKLFSNLFKNNLYSIDNTASRRDIKDSACKLEKVVTIGDLAFYDFVYTFEDTANNFFYIILVNKVKISYCELKKFSEYDLMFNKRIRLKHSPYFLALDPKEINAFKTIFKKLSNLSGKIFYTRY